MILRSQLRSLLSVATPYERGDAAWYGVATISWLLKMGELSNVTDFYVCACACACACMCVIFISLYMRQLMQLGGSPT